MTGNVSCHLFDTSNIKIMRKYRKEGGFLYDSHEYCTRDLWNVFFPPLCDCIFSSFKIPMRRHNKVIII